MSGNLTQTKGSVQQKLRLFTCQIKQSLIVIFHVGIVLDQGYFHFPWTSRGILIYLVLSWCCKSLYFQGLEGFKLFHPLIASRITCIGFLGLMFNLVRCFFFVFVHRVHHAHKLASRLQSCNTKKQPMFSLISYL